MEAFWSEYLKVLGLYATASSARAEPHWTAYLTALATPVVAALGLLIAYRQWVAARDRLRLDLYERRLAIYETLRSTLGQMFTKGQLNQEDEHRYLIGVSGARWLFDKDLFKYLDEEFWEKMMRHNLLVSELEGELSGDVRRGIAQEKSELRKWFLAQPKRANELFMPYLSFHDLAVFKRRMFDISGKR